MNTNKRGVTLDCQQDRDTLLRLVARADVLVHNYSPAQMATLRVVYDTFRRINPRLVMCSLAPFGLTDPHQHYKAYEITVDHGGGLAWLSPGGGDRPDLPPLKAAGHQADFQAGVAASTVTLAAYYNALQSGEGEHIDFSSQAYIASFIDVNAPNHTYQGQIASRLGKRVLYPWGIFPCQDGLIFLIVGEEDQWQRLISLMGNPKWSAWEIFQGFANRSQNPDVLHSYLEEWIKRWKAEDLFRSGQEQRICFAPVFTMAQLAQQEQLHARQFFIDVTHPRAGSLTHLGAPYRLHEPWWKIRRPAPLLGQHNEEIANEMEGREGETISHPSQSSNLKRQSSRRPLEGVRVADFSWVWADPFCAMHLAHLGAEVIKFESNVHLDLARRLAYYPKDMEPGVNRCALFNQWGQGKKNILLNLTTEKGISIAKELIKKSDVVLQNFATGIEDVEKPSTCPLRQSQGERRKSR